MNFQAQTQNQTMKHIILALCLCLSSLHAFAQAAPSGSLTIKITSPPTTAGAVSYTVYRRTSAGTVPGTNPTYKAVGIITLPATSVDLPTSETLVGLNYFAVTATYANGKESSKSGENSIDIPPGAPLAFTITLNP